MSSSYRRKALDVALTVALLLPFALLLVASMAPSANADSGWWNSDWLYRRSVDISGDHPENYQIELVLDKTDNLNDHCMDNFQDLRFLENKTSGELSFWIENYVDGDNATVWVKREENTDSSIYVYYGNSEANWKSDFDSTFSKEYDDNPTALWHMDEGSGDTLSDSSGNNYDGQRNGFTDGWIGSDGGQWNSRSDVVFSSGDSLTFDGSDDYVAIEDLHYDTSGEITELTVSAWVKIPAGGGDWSIVDFDRSEYYTCAAGIPDGGTTGTGDVVGFHTTSPNTSTGNGDMWGNIDVRDGNWHFITWVYDSSVTNEKKIFVDGQLDAEADQHPDGEGLGTGTTRYGFIGDGSEASSFDGSRNDIYYEGSIDEVRIYDRALNEDKIQTLYERRKYTSPKPGLSLGTEEASAPDLLEPVSGMATNDNTPIFRWDNGITADNWEIWIDNNPSFTSPEIKDNTIENYWDNYSEVGHPNGLSDENYFWKVRGYISGTKTSFSDNWNVLIDTVAPSAPPDSDSKGLVTDNNTPQLNWDTVTDSSDSPTGEVAGIDKYEIWIDNDSDFSSPEIQENIASGTITVPSELPDENYSYKIRVWDKAGNVGGWSDKWTFFVDATKFSLSVSSDSLFIVRGSKGSTDVTAKLTQGESENVGWSGEWTGTTPAGIGESFDPENTWLSGTSSLTFDSESDSATGKYTFRIVATTRDPEDNSGVTRENQTIEVDLTIAGMIFTIDSYPHSLELMRSDFGTITVSVNFSFGSKENVSLENSGWIGTSPGGVVTSFNPVTASPSYESTLTFSTSETAEAGTYTYRIKGSGGGLTRREDLTVNIKKDIELSVDTDRENYFRGEWITISGTADNPLGSPVTSGTATIELTSGDWSKKLTTEISNGTYTKDYFITFDNPPRDWQISITAEDNHGNLTSKPENTNITVTTPTNYSHYNVSFVSPPEGHTFSRGEEIQMTVQITEEGEAVRDADVYLATPEGEEVLLSEGSPGMYSTTYTPSWDASIGEWEIMVLGKKVTTSLKAGVSFSTIKIKNSPLQIELLSPTREEIEKGETIEVKAKITYPNGEPVSEAIVKVKTLQGKNLHLSGQGGGLYTTKYRVSSENDEKWTLQVSASDAHGNSKTLQATTINVTSPSPSTYAIRYWWTTLPILVAASLGVVPVFIGYLRKRRLIKIKDEREDLKDLREKTPQQYFAKGSISRETYEKRMKKYETRLTELAIEEKRLKRQLGRE